MKKVLVTGAKGQLGQTLQRDAGKSADWEFIFTDAEELDITSREQVNAFFHRHRPDFCINCAAYTQVDQAEDEPEKAYLINAVGPKNLALACRELNTTLIHISTDFVFDGKRKVPYTEEDEPNPLGVYGQTKWEGEKFIQEICPQRFIIRTSWLYSEYGRNFVTTMISLGKEKDSIRIVADQVGTPTYAIDLASIILQIIDSGSNRFGTYNYSSEGVASWYDFAVAIFEELQKDIKVIPITTQDYPTDAQRPSFSVLNKAKIKENLGITIPHWRQTLRSCLSKLD
ncbi:dTDP-4-dehydrorhamnose reductase [Robiginitalea sp. M366]|uniref:dTDP-4-dehydrorhamnose reductase n=1 Tax=Robiginitalea aestuariiviva TaxID=3036903 RepID=UPI00240E25F7|nr:dTDP-4-dehydrorhamnose reductase [Robiginitalea aestuariiviva]MDG1571482.1 dTDP-4-dehydrorhamnose reductase [Robiginitalea aestuariiviva]